MRTQTLPQQSQLSSVAASLGGTTSMESAWAPCGQDCSVTSVDREALIMQHLSMVRFVARGIYERLPQHMELDELISAGLVGLIDAASKFDGSKQVQFRSYAQFRIRGAILDSLRLLDWSPRELRRKGRAMAEAIRCLSAQLGRTPIEAEVAGEMGLDLKSYQQMLADLKGLEIERLNTTYSDIPGDEELEQVPAKAEDDPLSLCIRNENKEQLAAALESLQEKERLVLTLYYHEELTLKEIGLT